MLEQKETKTASGSDPSVVGGRVVEGSFAAEILRWWSGRRRRDFPWRRTSDPYRVLVAEILLQRTKAEQVVPIYEEFLRRYPSLYELARAELEEIEETVRPLGLAKRARLLKSLAEVLVTRFRGEVPRSAEALLELPGVGYYTANAVLCFAYGEDVPLVDWNVARVVKRIWNIPMKRAPHTDKKLMEFAARLVPQGKGREFNLALLDFSAEICRPRNPECRSCPVSQMCDYFRRMGGGSGKV